jgi:hypothetical protein
VDVCARDRDPTTCPSSTATHEGADAIACPGSPIYSPAPPFTFPAHQQQPSVFQGLNITHRHFLSFFPEKKHKMWVTRAISLTNFVVASSALGFQVFVLYPWHEQLSEDFENLKKEHLRVLDALGKVETERRKEKVQQSPAPSLLARAWPQRETQ